MALKKTIPWCCWLLICVLTVIGLTPGPTFESVPALSRIPAIAGSLAISGIPAVAFVPILLMLFLRLLSFLQLLASLLTKSLHCKLYLLCLVSYVGNFSHAP